MFERKPAKEEENNLPVGSRRRRRNQDDRGDDCGEGCAGRSPHGEKAGESAGCRLTSAPRAVSLESMSS